MFGSFRVGSAFGITIRVHFLFVVVFAAVALLQPEQAWLLLPLVAIVLLHELGHSLVAQRFGIRVLDITFWPLGGIARMSDIPEDTKVEALIAIAGPAVNFALVALTVPVWLALLPIGGPAHDFAFAFICMNLILGTFNLIPAFPMDGGRVLRALLGRKGDWVRATERAVHVGRFAAVLMGLVGFFLGYPFLPFIALWIWWVGGQELAAVRRRHAQDPLAGLRWFAQARAASERAARERSAAESGAGEPVHAAAQPAAAAPRREGFSDEEIERLEQFRGPLRQYRPE